MFKRVTIVALVVAAFLVLAVPALAWNGYRADYTTSRGCAPCHSGIAGIPTVYPEWKESKHGEGDAYLDVYNRLPYASVCQGCHTSNFDPSKLTPTPTATSSSGVVSWAAQPAPTATGTAFPMDTQSSGNLAWSESSIGCSSCHYGTNVVDPIFGADANDSAHNVPFANMADAQICGACHSRYSYTTDTYTVQPVPYLTVVAGSPVPNPNPTTLIQPQMAIGYPMLGSPSPSPAWNPVLPDYLNLSYPGWTPNPTATQAGFASLQTFWQIDGHDSEWEQSGHDGGAQQYGEWYTEGLDVGHRGALEALKQIGQGDNPECLKCHSADYRIMKAAGKLETADQQNNFTAKYGVTCVGCHTPHDAGTAKGVWDDAFDTQLIGDPKNPSDACITCHTAGLPDGTTASPGARFHSTAKEVVNGYGAIDVPGAPGVHKGKCIQCHMPPTTISRGAVQLGGNHTYKFITPRDAVEASPVPYVTSAAVAIATATPVPGGTPVVTSSAVATWDSMPFSSCSTCHSNSNSVKATPIPVGTRTITPSPSSSPIRVTVITDQLANGTSVGNMGGGDKGIWLQDTIDDRQQWTKDKIAQIHTELDKAAVALGYSDTAAAQAALIAVPQNQWTTAQRAFLSAYTNVRIAEAEGSFGLHNWAYSSAIVNKAMEQAKIAETGVIVKLPWVVKFAMSRSSVKSGAAVTFSGTVKTSKGVAGAGTVKIMKRVHGVWKVWKSARLNATGNYSLKVTMKTRGTFYMRAYMAADDLNKAAYSRPNKKLVVK